MTARAPIAFLLITKDEEKNLPHALASISDWAQEIFVLDSGSTDGTREVAERFGAQFHFHAWEGYVAQKNWGLSNLPITAPWVFILDADESITPPLRDELTRIASEDRCPENGFYVNRYFIFLGKRIRHCGYYPSWNIRFFRSGKALYEQRDVHEHMLVSGGVGYLKHDMEHYERRGLEHYIAKHNQYSTLEARAMHRQLQQASQAMAGSFWGDSQQRRRWLKSRVWPRLPARWMLRFLYMYIVKLGFLDGPVGFHFCLFLMGYEHQVGLKLREMGSRAGACRPGPAESPSICPINESAEPGTRKVAPDTPR
jgi:glycosyltransferase involved in cell wall biosynthesis